MLASLLLLDWPLGLPIILDFALGRQENLRLVRERDGLAKTSKARNPNVTLTDEGKVFLERVVAARERGDWQNTKTIFRTYTGVELPVFMLCYMLPSTVGSLKKVRPFTRGSAT